MPYQTVDIVNNLPVQPLHILQVIDSLQFASASISNFRAGRTNFGANTFSSNAQVEMHDYSGQNPLAIYSGSNQVFAIDALGNTVVTGSLKVSGSNTLIGTKTITGSVFINGSKTIVGTNTITGSLNVLGATAIVGGLTATSLTGSFTGSLTGTLTGTATTASNITPAITNNVNNAVLTANGGGTLTGEPNFTFDGSIMIVSGSVNITGSNTLIGTNTVSGSVNITGSMNLIGTKTITGSIFISGSKTIIGSNTITGSLNVSGSTVIVGGLTATSITGSFSGSLTGTVTTASNITPAFTTGNANNYVLTSNGNGTITGESNLYFDGTKLGIGTSSPTDPLNIVNGANYFKFGGLGTQYAYMKAYEFNVQMGNAFGGSLSFLVGDSVKAHINTAGNLLVGTNTSSYDGVNPEQLLVSGSNINTIVGKTSIDNYTQLNIINTSGSANASADVVATNNAGTENGNYVNMGINSSGFAATATSVGIANDAYLYNTGSAGASLWIGNTTPGANSSIKFFAGNIGTYAAMTMVSSSLTLTGSLVVTGSVTITGSLNVQGVVTGSFKGDGSGLTNVGSIQTSGSSLYSTNPATLGFTTTNGIFLGDSAGQNATATIGSNFIGYLAGQAATNADRSNFIGYTPGQSATNANNSNFLGNSAGALATNASQSNFIGRGTGANATNAHNSNFLGYFAGQAATSASYSTLIGYNVSYNAAGGALGIKSNNVIVGTNITLPDGARDSINLGGIVFATGSYGTIGGNPSSGSQYGIGKVGINIVTPKYTLDVSGSGNYTNSLTVTGSFLIASGSTNDIVGTSLPMVAGKIAVSTTAVTANSKVFVSYNNYAGGGGSGSLYVPSTSIIAGSKFGITSSYAGDTSTVNWFLIN